VVCPAVSFSLTIPLNGRIILPVVLYGCKTWSLTLREERRVRALEKRGFEEIIWTEDCLKKDKGHTCTGTEALYRPYGP
jgi:hypothetical protein